MRSLQSCGNTKIGVSPNAISRPTACDRLQTQFFINERHLEIDAAKHVAHG